ncbi:hypothetical protein EC957_010603 [Mortierella hygrophila]|uniref:Uncharacterized protein n=1 Tax=Mortierella hygrophila TaxID=979708 RepID=A0A9P6EUS9_9FUNG|nr:hypothetical protein EC957_010603 [Mortierella hygrophila]
MNHFLATSFPHPKIFVRTDYEETSDAVLDSIPSKSMSCRPIWTWDLELPKLTYVSLHAEFACTFQFRMLPGTPSLHGLKYIHAPALTHLYLYGIWTLDGQVLAAFFSKVMFNITDAHLRDSGGFAIAEWVSAMSTYFYHVNTAAVYTLPGPAGLFEVGLILIPGIIPSQLITL